MEQNMLYFHSTLFLKGERRQQKRKYKIGPFEHLRPVFGTKNRILEIGLSERALTLKSTSYGKDSLLGQLSLMQYISERKRGNKLRSCGALPA